MKRVVIVSGACGVGKSETLHSMRAALTDRVADVAVLETDHFYMMFDPQWALSPERAERYFELSGWLLRETVLKLVGAGIDWIAIGSNGLYDESRVREFIAPLLIDDVAAFHVTLHPGPETQRQRIAHRIATRGYAVDVDKTPEWLESQLSWFYDRTGPWTCVIDNAAMTPAQTAIAIYDAVVGGCGRLA